MATPFLRVPPAALRECLTDTSTRMTIPALYETARRIQGEQIVRDAEIVILSAEIRAEIAELRAELERASDS